METLLVKESSAALQIVCPYCQKTQIDSTALHVMHNPVDFWKCNYCKKVGRGAYKGRVNAKKLDSYEPGPIYFR